MTFLCLCTAGSFHRPPEVMDNSQFVHDAPGMPGTHAGGLPQVSSMGLQPLRGFLRAAPIACVALYSRTCAPAMAGQKYHYPFSGSPPAGLLSGFLLSVVIAHFRYFKRSSRTLSGSP